MLPSGLSEPSSQVEPVRTIQNSVKQKPFLVLFIFSAVHKFVQKKMVDLPEFLSCGVILMAGSRNGSLCVYS